MALILEIKQSVGVVIPSGSLDASAVESLRSQVTAWWDAHPELKQIVVDLGAVGFMDSSGLGALIGMLKRVAARGGDVKLARPRPSVKLVLEITRANKIFTICGTMEEALAPAPSTA
jgi:anti-sigma B factor antagonist